MRAPAKPISSWEGSDERIQADALGTVLLVACLCARTEGRFALGSEYFREESEAR